MFRPNLFYLIARMITGQVFKQIINKLVALTSRRRFYSKTPLNRPTLPMHLFAIIIKHSVIKHAVQRPLRDFFKLIVQSKVATLASGESHEMRHDYAEATLPTLSSSRLLYVVDKRNKCKYLIDTAAAKRVLHKSCANRTTDTNSLPL